MWKSLPYASKRTLIDVVLRAQNNVTKLKQELKEDSKTRRRRLYKILSEERPVFPAQETNFYTMVMDNKEIIKLLGMLSTCTMELRQVIYHEMLSKFLGVTWGSHIIFGAENTAECFIQN